jgi:vitamin B12 transporter
MAGYALLSAFTRYHMTSEWSLELSGNNLTDRKYELARGYNVLGRQLQLTIRFTSGNF